MKFAVGERHDFMAPVEFTSVTGGLADSIQFQWKKIPTAIGYFAMAIGHNDKDRRDDSLVIERRSGPGIRPDELSASGRCQPIHPG